MFFYCNTCGGYFERPHIHDIPFPVVEVPEHHTYKLKHPPKQVHEALCVALYRMRAMVFKPEPHYYEILHDLLLECERKRPLGPNGKHGNLHTDECGCDPDVSTPPRSHIL